ncbi:MAG: glycosyl hydrolase family 8 [Pseudobdellovibrionaceae bacterium]
MSLLALFILSLATFSGAAWGGPVSPSAEYIQKLDELSSLWSFYKRVYIKDGQVISPDEGGITTSEGQGYALLRAVWSNDRRTFDLVWDWTHNHLQVREDQLFAWKFKNRVIDKHAATDADTDIALALILAARRFDEPKYLKAAQAIIQDIWNREILLLNNRYFVTGGDWGPSEAYPTIHLAYLAPYAYEIFAQVDSSHPWKQVIKTSYEILHWVFIEKGYKLPPMKVFIDKKTGNLLLQKPGDSTEPLFSYDVFPLYWRMALDSSWFSRDQRALRATMLSFLQEEWGRHGKLYDQYTLDGQARSKVEALPLYATVHTLAVINGEKWAEALWSHQLQPLWKSALKSGTTPYYLQNWLWFNRAVNLDVAIHFDETLGFLRPFDFQSFAMNFQWVLFGLALLLFFFAQRFYYARIGFVAIAFYLCAYYLIWRLFNTLNFLEKTGPLISIMVWAAEVYCFSTVVLLTVQVGLRNPKALQKTKPTPPEDFQPNIDILIPIYSEPLSILERTLWAAMNIDYPNKKIFVCDDSHQESVKELTEKLGGHYILGPKKHAKAGNMNNALSKTQGELVVIFDTDHIPVSSFLKETVPYFVDSKIGFVQTPHHFYNEDIFQRAFGTKNRIPNEQDMFNHAIQDGRNSWGGSFFVGSGAVFRRCAIDSVGGFKYLSITEDIHTSQHLHAQGWSSAFVDKDLAVGLTAENLMSYLVQRRRWMLGCLQIFFKDNPLFQKGLSLRHRLGYFASLYYFFFPLARLIFLLAPLFFLLFQMHPIFSEVSLLLAHLLPFMVLLPMLTLVLMPTWPRMLWGTVYENVIAVPLVRSMFDLFLPKALGFKVTPKGIVSQRGSFDFQSSRLTLVICAITLFAICKGLWEFYFFQIEKDAYFFNLAWAGYNCLSLLVALAVAWEKPQSREEERLQLETPFEFHSGNFIYSGVSSDISLTGLGFRTDKLKEFPSTGTVHFKELGIQLSGEVVYNERHWLSTRRFGVKFLSMTEDERHSLFLKIFTEPARWQHVHENRIRSNFGIGIEFYRGISKVFLSLIPWALKCAREKTMKGTSSGENRTTL